MLRRVIVIVIFTVTLLALSREVAVAASPKPAASKVANNKSVSADEFLQNGFQQLLEATRNTRSGSPEILSKAARPILDRYIDFSSLTRRAFGLGWKDLSPQEQKEAQQLLSEVIIRNYASKIRPESAPKVKFGAPKKLDASRQEVASSINNDGSDVQVTYRLESTGKSWAVYEILVEGVSLTNSYRSQFDALRTRSGPKAPLESLRSMLK
jgi:phospholipid transport system substrate-binding protein